MNSLCTAGKKPDIGQLLCLDFEKDGEEISVEIISDASHKWRDIARALASSKPNLVANLSRKHQDNQEECLNEVFVEHFINNKPEKYTNDWAGLIKLLNKVKLGELSKKVKEAVLIALSE